MMMMMILSQRCTSRSLVRHRHIWLMTSTLSPTAAAAFSDHPPTDIVSSRVHTTLLATGVSLLPVGRCGTIYRLSCERTSAIYPYLCQNLQCPGAFFEL